MSYVIILEPDSVFAMVVEELFKTLEAAEAYVDRWVSNGRDYRIVPISWPA